MDRQKVVVVICTKLKNVWIDLKTQDHFGNIVVFYFDACCCTWITKNIRRLPFTQWMMVCTFLGTYMLKQEKKIPLYQNELLTSWKIKFWLKFFFWPIWVVKNGKNDFLLFSKKWNCIKKIRKRVYSCCFSDFKNLTF